MHTEIVLITGAGQGIGYAIAKALAHSQRTLILTGREEDKLAKVAEELRPLCREVHYIPGDLTAPQVQSTVVSTALQKYGHIDVLINNAGVAHNLIPLTDISDAEFDVHFNVNTKLPFQLMRAFLPAMQARRNGLIINISSAANISGYKDLSVYSATKAALTSLTGSVAAENAEYGIKAISVLPSRTNTPMQVRIRGQAVADTSQPPEFVADVIRRIVDEEIPIKTGDDVLVRNSKFVVAGDIISR